MEIYPGRGIPMKNFVEHYLLQELLTIKQWSNAALVVNGAPMIFVNQSLLT